MELKVKESFQEIAKDYQAIGTKGIRTSAQRGLNKAGAKLNTRAKRAGSDATQVKTQSVIKGQFSLRRAFGSSLTAVLTVHDKAVGVERIKGTRSRSRGGRVQSLTFRGKIFRKAFHLGKNKTSRDPFFIEKQGRVKRVYSYLLLQEMEKKRKFIELQTEGLKDFEAEYVRQLELAWRRRGWR